MIVYAIASKVTEVCGMNDSVDLLVVRPLNPYGSGPYPPLFREKEKAESYLSQMGWLGREAEVIELELW